MDLTPVQDEMTQSDRPRSAPANRSVIYSLAAILLGALIAGVLEGLYLSNQDTVADLEIYALGLVEAGLAISFVTLMVFPGVFLNRLALYIYIIAVLYILTMMASALFLDHDPARSLHSILWFHPVFIAVSLTQSGKFAQSLSWLVIALLSGIVAYYDSTIGGDVFQSAAASNHWIIILSLCATTALLYSLSKVRETQGADRARIDVLQQSAIALSKEVKATRQARAELEQANAVVAGFLDNMSHELRTPLNGIIGFSELVHGEMFGPLNNEKYKEYLGDILGAGQHMLGLVNNLLYFSQLSAERIRLVPISVEILDILNEAADAARTKAADSGVEIEVDVEGSPFLIADSTAIVRMMDSVLDNAIKFSTAGGKIYLAGRQKPDGQCEISVRDTGVGIVAADLMTILLPFRKGGHSESNAMPGSGLGLALTKILMDLHRGSVSIDSTPGKGTCVTLLFPAPTSPSTSV